MCRGLHALLLALVLLPLLLMGGGLAAAEDETPADAARRYARERLLREARRSVGTSPDADVNRGLESLQRSLVGDISFLMSYPATTDEERALLAELEKTITERILMIGEPSQGDREVVDHDAMGALQEARMLHGWLVGTKPCHVLVAPAKTDLLDGNQYPYPPRPPESPAPEPLEGQGEDAPPEGGAPSGPPPAALGEGAPAGDPPPVGSGGEAASAGETAAKPVPEPTPAPAAGTPDPSEPEPPPTTDAWAREVVRPAEGGTLRGKAMGPARCTTATALERVGALPPVYVHPEVETLKRYAIIAKEIFAYNAPSVALRLLQAEERNIAMQGDRPPVSFVDSGMVRQKAARAGIYHAEVAQRVEQRATILRELDAMVDDVDAWNTQAALLAQEIETARRAVTVEEALAEVAARLAASPRGSLGWLGRLAARVLGSVPPESDAPRPTPAALVLRLAQARESLASLDLTLIHLTAVRAEVRLRLLELLLRAAEEEATAADQVRVRYDTALVELRNARRLDRLGGDERRLAKWSAPLRKSELEAGSVYARRLAAYDALLAVNRVVQEAVLQRQQVTTRGAAATQETTEQSGDAKGTNGGPDGAPTALATDGSAAGRKLSAVMRAPETRTWDVKYIELASRELLDPELADEFDATLVAAHYSAVDDQIAGLVLSRATQAQDEALRSRFEGSSTTAQGALDQLRDDSFSMEIRRLPNLLQASTEDFEAAMDGIAGQRRHNKERLRALLDYRRLLRDQGVRSLLIRTDRDLADDSLAAAARDSVHAVDAATRWIGTSEMDGAGGWLRTHWLRLLAFLVAIAAGVGLVRFGRGWLDRRIEHLVAAHPALRGQTGSVREEQAERRREEAEIVAGPSEEEVLLQGAAAADAAASADASADAAASAEVSAEEAAVPKGAAGTETPVDATGPTPKAPPSKGEPPKEASAPKEESR